VGTRLKYLLTTYSEFYL